MSTFTIPYTITDNDYLAFNNYHLRYTKTGRKALLSMRLIAPVLSLFALILFWIAECDLYFIIVELVAFIIFSIIWWLSARRFMLHSIKRRLKKAHDTDQLLFSPNGQLIFDFENRVIMDITDKAETKISFDKIKTYYETDTAYYFYFSSIQAILLPRHLFHSTEEFISFQNLVHSNFCHCSTAVMTTPHMLTL